MKNQPWPAHNVERRPLAALIPYAGNARTHSPEQVEQIAASIREWGWTMPILIDEKDGILAGHGRVLAAQLLGMDEVPVIVASGWSEAQKRAYVLADNKLAENAGWDSDLLKVEIGSLTDLGFDLGLAGFSSEDIANIRAWGKTGKTDPDDVPEPPAIPATETGDVWLLGPHRLVCGDCTDPAVVGACLGQERPHLMVTDPPYGVGYDPGWRHTARRSTGELLSTGQHSMGKVANDDRVNWHDAWVNFPGDVAYVWHSGLHCAAVQQSLEAVGLIMRSQIIWNKNVMIISRGHYHFKHEPCWYAVRKSKNAHWNSDRKQTSVWDIPIVHATAGDVDDGKNHHGTQKPVECMRRPIENNSMAGDAVYDPFIGSGTTIIAAEMTGRRCFAIEIDPIYVDVAVRRWQDFTGKTATLEATGETLADRADAQTARTRLEEISSNPTALVSGDALHEMATQ